ncbi:hypothetical protein [Clostridium fallax]|uniref:Uncharacterized protein n=1 Tax=Clostridium fallax TaxID=1533 RepID=A0A1M4V0U7_9CLOT|nr:hypothetical protein [Clostridium fallax]SHE62596.1 hypothetical protein SAMN05443638_10691 [Clostridium fallax]SQB06602.1 Uncharacterised protein [Clostridium fallax]
MYAIRKNHIYKAIKIKPNKRETALWCRLDNSNKYYLISTKNLFNNFIDAFNHLKRK